MNQLAIISGFLGAVKNRYMTYREDRPFKDKVALAQCISGLSGLELCYPQDFTGDTDGSKAAQIMNDHGLSVSAVNFRSRRTGTWWRGSFSSQDTAERREAVDDLKRAMDIAARLGCNRITTCPLNEGHDYPFEMDYLQAFDFMAESLCRAADHNSQVRLCLEYKWNDPRTRCLLGNAGETLAFCQTCERPNIGVTLDFGHAVQAGERPAQSAALLAKAGRLFYIHLNDNDKFWDWDMIPGAYNFWDMVEFFYYVRKLGYDDWFAFDVFSKEIDTLETFNAVTKITKKLWDFSARLDEEQVKNLLKQRNPVASIEYLYSLL
jgi:xylose isomerase